MGFYEPYGLPLKVDGAITGKWQEVFEAVVYKLTKYL
jgi:hypothetical protein